MSHKDDVIKTAKLPNFYPTFFQSSVNKKNRVIDLISLTYEKEKQKMLMYDKKMSSILIYLQFEEALASNDVINIKRLREEMNNLIERLFSSWF
ncbi:hypothetical protein [Legionella longbeachae]|uniref:Uncharacterized protein n=1 Tax=Legionella longbeachae serogroup 1 (strain NSW150) TaxID=661367 RepID=D3HTC7_LEGLN|nr:hypothetical protein [Legionella longbeachae]VEE02660.1 Uncharacterised protein [Legionella oakridgensis]HBD7397923.1 hypothetical protein [Legionella pneumophila]ARB91074.1 hypothetical protein A6J40_02250 [Legionella longbeachae]ARM32498.1 hypothetical protein B0B39_02660 [Legionella longbeachae]QEY51752.1 hypothetical protein FQU71_11145 [Legionella longbeachae]